MATITDRSAWTASRKDITRRDLDVFFKPNSVAVIGATDRAGHVGRSVLWNLISSPFGGTVYPVNLKKHSVLGIRAYPNVASLPEPAELAVIVTPAETVPGVVEECARSGVRGAVIISAGFRESGPRGLELERQILAAARPAKMRIIGPNCLGVMCPLSGLNATFAHTVARPGTVAFVSQSGAMCTAILDWSLSEQIGFSAFISAGSMLDVGWGSLIDYLGDDPGTRSIVVYMESIGDARSFLSAAREVALNKPIIVIKAGRTEQAAKAAASHTGSMSGSDDVLEAAFRRVGVLRVNSISDIFYMTEVLANQPRPKGPKLAIVTNAGGPGVIATDALLLEGGELAELSSATLEALNRILPAHWSRNNPVDIIGDAGPDRYEQAVEIVAKDPNADGLLAIMTPQGMTNPAAIAERLTRFAKLDQKPILASWMGGAEAAQGVAVLNHAGIPTFPFPDTAVRAFHYMWKYSYNLRGLYETPALTSPDGMDPGAAARVIDGARQANRTLLTEFESKQVLQAYGIPVAETRLASNQDEAVAAGEAIGFPVVLKLHSARITHKTDVGGVKLNLRDAAAVRDAFQAIRASVSEKAGSQHFGGVTVQPMVSNEGYELILGSSIDAQFGPVLLFGTGGQLVEVFRDRALSLPPLNTTLARRFIEQTKIFTALCGVRGRKPVDLPALEELLVKFSRLVTEQRWIREIDINPLLASPDRLIALDARIVVYGQDVTVAELPRLAIRPYPSRYQTKIQLHDGSEISIRPIRPEDEPLLVTFHETLSERSVYLRYFHWMKLEQRTEHERLTRMCFIDYDRQMAFVAERIAALTGERQIVAVGRLVKSHTADEAELAIIVSDGFHRRGIGTELVRQLVGFARDEKLERITATVLFENRPMQRVFEKVGFRLEQSADPEALEAVLVL
ncbi:MAG TPA: bifunctional acetate--CoA ligase family protein/GNAT family N-acetyltransferase [Bryobacteraceae bacterium]|nr:bifunctional acetate--CoA ligase family protein/GNAT family N-acetyltransferase [Bryobacteraceae bacterium]